MQPPYGWVWKQPFSMSGYLEFKAIYTKMAVMELSSSESGTFHFKFQVSQEENVKCFVFLFL